MDSPPIGELPVSSRGRVFFGMFRLEEDLWIESTQCGCL
jgi:hypothetical protein